MRMLMLAMICVIILSSCSVHAAEMPNNEDDKTYHVSKITETEKSEVNDMQNLNGIWVSQFDMHPIYRDGGKQREKADFESKIDIMMDNLTRDGFNTIFLQVRPNGDSMYESEIFPNSKYIAGIYGGNIDYDAVEIIVTKAKAAGISIHAWINPYRLCTLDELIAYGRGQLFDWLKEGIGNRIEQSPDTGILYLDPSYEEATELICRGAKEILEKYDFDGIHIDDYFYPTEFVFDDEKEFAASGFGDKSEFRIANTNRTVKALYDTVHEFEGKIFGVSPAGNLDALARRWYVDVRKWCEEDGYTDYIMPQIYFGFEHILCPFEKALGDWAGIMKNENVKLYIGLSAAKCVYGSEGKADTYAGEAGQYEWRDNKDILARSLTAIRGTEEADGFCIFAYTSFYNPLTGEDNPLSVQEKTAFCEVLN